MTTETTNQAAEVTSQSIHTPQDKYTDVEGSCYNVTETAASSIAHRIQYDHSHSTICRQDAPCEVKMTVDVAKLERRRSISKFNEKRR